MFNKVLSEVNRDRLKYTLFFFFIFFLSSSVFYLFSAGWPVDAPVFYGSPFATHNHGGFFVGVNTGTPRWILGGLLLNFVVWGIVAFIAQEILRRFWDLKKSTQIPLLVAFVVLLLSLYNIDINSSYFAAGWPLQSIQAGNLLILPLVVNTLLAVALALFAYKSASIIRKTPICFPGIKTILLLLVYFLILFVAIAALIPSAQGLSPEQYIQENFVLQTGFWKELVSRATFLGTPPYALFLSLVILLGMRGIDNRLAFLPILASIILMISVPEMKEVIERFRPPTATLPDYALPAGHAAVSVVYVAFALFFIKTKFGGLALLSGIIAAILLGIFRIFLGLHWFGDLLGGWAWGGFIYALTALILFGLQKLYRKIQKKDGSSLPTTSSSTGGS